MVSAHEEVEAAHDTVEAGAAYDTVKLVAAQGAVELVVAVHDGVELVTAMMQ